MAKNLYYAVQRSMIFAMRPPRLSGISPNGTSAIQLVTRHVSRKNTSYDFTHEVMKHPLVLTLFWFWSISALGLHWFRVLVQLAVGVDVWDFSLDWYPYVLLDLHNVEIGSGLLRFYCQYTLRLNWGKFFYTRNLFQSSLTLRYFMYEILHLLSPICQQPFEIFNQVRAWKTAVHMLGL